MKLTKDSFYLAPFWGSLLITNFLFFIDEGYNDFRWMKDPGNWFVFVIYVVVIYAFLLALTLIVLQAGRWVRRFSSSPR